jgi:hypothetical protein
MKEPLGTHRTIRRAHDRATDRKEGTVGRSSERNVRPSVKLSR